MDNVCIICREEMVTGAKRLPCNHIFHTSCLRSWFQRQQTCPTCRMDVLRASLPNQSPPPPEPADQGPPPAPHPPPLLPQPPNFPQGLLPPFPPGMFPLWPPMGPFPPVPPPPAQGRLRPLLPPVQPFLGPVEQPQPQLLLLPPPRRLALPPPPKPAPPRASPSLLPGWACRCLHPLPSPQCLCLLLALPG